MTDQQPSSRNHKSKQSRKYVISKEITDTNFFTPIFIHKF